MLAVILDSATLKTTIVDLIVALEEMSENHQVPLGTLDIYNKPCGGPSWG